MMRPTLILSIAVLFLFCLGGLAFAQEEPDPAPAKAAAMGSAQAPYFGGGTDVDFTNVHIAMELEKHETAAALLRKIIEAKGPSEGPGIIDAHKYLGMTLLAMGREDPAYNEFVTALRMNRKTFLDPEFATPEAKALFAKARDSLVALDIDVPKIELLPIGRGTEGLDKEIQVKVTDDVHVESVLLYYKKFGKF